MHHSCGHHLSSALWRKKNGKKMSGIGVCTHPFFIRANFIHWRHLSPTSAWTPLLYSRAWELTRYVRSQVSRRSLKNLTQKLPNLETRKGIAYPFYAVIYMFVHLLYSWMVTLACNSFICNSTSILYKFFCTYQPDRLLFGLVINSVLRAQDANAIDTTRSFSVCHSGLCGSLLRAHLQSR
jgi:hypothetical protein